MAQGFEKVNARIDDLGKEMAGLRGIVKATFLIVSVATSAVTIAGVIVGAGKALHWF
jgi:hypothetical protein